jgi:hippurate hydrolase
MVPNDGIDSITAEIADRLIQIRRTIHQHPELAFEETATADLVARVLADLGVLHRRGVGKTGVIGLIAGAKSGRTVGIRADMDALPIQENTGLPYASTEAGKMHACGHDAHTAILLGVAMVLCRMRDRLAGQVKLIFQPAEETLAGAAAMIADGALENPAVDIMLGYHNWPLLDAGSIGYHPGVSFASSDAFDVTVSGTSGHAAHPHLAVDAITAAAYFVTQLQTIVSREVAPVRPAVVTIGRIAGGTARNIFADSVRLEGTVRAHDEATRTSIEEAMRRMLHGLKLGMRTDFALDYRRGVPVLKNHPATIARVLASARAIVGAEKVVELPEGSMGSEDFACFSERVPAAYLRLGSKVEGRPSMIHRADFIPDELVIPTGVRVVSRAALDLLE